jgi:hypothetical protein
MYIKSNLPNLPIDFKKQVFQTFWWEYFTSIPWIGDSLLTVPPLRGGDRGEGVL